jgi:DKNYY family
LDAFPGRARELEEADAASFEAVTSTYARDKTNVYFFGRPIPGADPSSFELLDRAGIFKDRNHAYLNDQPISDDRESVAASPAQWWPRSTQWGRRPPAPR